MSFGYSVSDVLSVANTCWMVYKKCKGSSGEFKDVAVEVSCLHSVLKETEEVLSEENLSNQQQARLKPLKDGILDLLKELERRLEKYESLGTQSKRALDRIGWAMEGGVAELRQKLISQTTLLDAFKNSASHTRLERKLSLLVNEIRAGKRQGSVISSQTFDCNDRHTWEELRRELEDIGISWDVIREKRPFIIAWFQEAIAAAGLDEDVPDSANDGERAPDNDDMGSTQEFSEQKLVSIRQAIEAAMNEERPKLITLKPKTPRKITSRLRPSYLLYVLNSGEQLLDAVEARDKVKVEQLLGWGANINYHSTKKKPHLKDRTPLSIASDRGYPAMVAMLIESGANINAKSCRGDTALHGAVRNGKEIVLQILIDSGAGIDIRGESGWTALLYAASYHHLTMVRLLLIKGANIEAKNSHDETALHVAVRSVHSKSHIAVAQMLIDSRVDIDARDSSGRTALHLATYTRNPALAKFLVDKGANIELKTCEGLTARELADNLQGHGHYWDAELESLTYCLIMKST